MQCLLRGRNLISIDDTTRTPPYSALHLQLEIPVWRKLGSTFDYFRTNVWRGSGILGVVWRTFCIISPWGISLASDVDMASDLWVWSWSWEIVKVLNNSCLRLSYRVPKPAAVLGSVTDISERRLCSSRSQLCNAAVRSLDYCSGTGGWHRYVYIYIYDVYTYVHIRFRNQIFLPKK